MKLTQLQRDFARAYARDARSAADALRRAGSKAKGGALYANASKLLKMAKVQREIERQRQSLAIERGEKLEFDPSRPLKSAKDEAFLCALISQEQGMNLADAWYAAGHRPRTREAARANACRRLTNANVLARFEWLKNQAADESITTDAERKRILSEIERARFGDFLDEESKTIPLTRENLQSRAIQSLDIQELYEGRGDDRQNIGRIVKIRLRDPVSAIHEHNLITGGHAPSKHQVAGGVLVIESKMPEPAALPEEYGGGQAKAQDYAQAREREG